MCLQFFFFFSVSGFREKKYSTKFSSSNQFRRNKQSSSGEPRKCISFLRRIVWSATKMTKTLVNILSHLSFSLAVAAELRIQRTCSTEMNKSIEMQFVGARWYVGWMHWMYQSIGVCVCLYMSVCVCVDRSEVLGCNENIRTSCRTYGTPCSTC